jgi:mitogen-activated protein kinase 7
VRSKTQLTIAAIKQTSPLFRRASQQYNNTMIAVVGEDETHRSYNVKGCLFTVPHYFTIEKALGVGAYGVVWCELFSNRWRSLNRLSTVYSAAVDVRQNANVAIKKIGRAFDDLRDCKRTLREIKILRHFANHENVSCIVVHLHF